MKYTPPKIIFLMKKSRILKTVPCIEKCRNGLSIAYIQTISKNKNENHLGVEYRIVKNVFSPKTP